jgi:hypothetical protein
LISGKSSAEESRNQFEWWALGKVQLAPAQDKKKVCGQWYLMHY